jgi:CheY-like chemotaxis protein
MIKKRLLIVEDDPKFRKLIKMVLAADSYQFVEVDSIRGALQACSELEGPYVVLLDLELPDGNGREFIKRLGANVVDFRIIVLTAHEDYLRAELAEQLQIFNYLPKTQKLTEPLRFAVSQAFKDIELEQLKRRLKVLTRNPIRVFISYTNPDFEKVHWIYSRLKDNNSFKPWMADRDMFPGANWKKQVQQAIDDCHFVLSCLSDISVKRLSYFRTETRLAAAKHDQVGEPFIIPLKFDNCEMPREFTKRNIQCISYDSLHDDWWLKLLKTLRSEV